MGTFDILINWFGFNIDVAMWSQQLSFIVVGIIVVSSTRGLLLTMSKFFIWISSSKSSNVLVLFFSQIMGMYIMSISIDENEHASRVPSYNYFCSRRFTV